MKSKYIKIGLLLSSLPFLQACSSVTSSIKELTEEPPENAASTTALQPGVIKIRKENGDHKVDLELDVGTDNIVFVMDMPSGLNVEKDGETLDLEKEIEANTPSNEAIEDFPDSSANAQLEHKELDAESSIIESRKQFARGQYLDSLSTIDELLAENPSNATALAIKGSIYYQLGELSQAKFFWRRALAIDPTMSDVEEGLRAIEGRN